MAAVAALSVLASVASGCAGSSADDEQGAPAATTTVTTADPFTASAGTAPPGGDVDTSSTASSTASTTSTTVIADGPLAEVCEPTIVVQLADLPSPHAGPLYELLGPSATTDGAGTTAGPLTRPDGTVDDIVLEIRSGGPTVDFESALDLLAADPTITLAVASLPAIVDSVASPDPAVGVVSLTDVSSSAILWDPATYPDVDTLRGLADADVEIHHRPGATFVDVLVAGGTLDPAELVDDYFGEPAAFVAARGAIAQQADALVDTILLPTLPQWGRSIAFELAAEEGWTSYDDVVVARTSAVGADADCLGRLVPVVQEAIAAYVSDPTRTDARIASLRSEINPLTRVDPVLLDDGVAAGLELGVFGVSPNGLGGFDDDRVADFVASLPAFAGLDDVALDSLVTNRFVDPDRTL